VSDLVQHPPVRRPSASGAIPELDADLRRAVVRTSHVRRCFYAVVLAVALAGQVSGAVQALHIPLLWAIPAVAGLELGGIVVLANADVRRRLGERAVASRLLSALIAAGAVAFNWLAHANHLLGGFFAGMSALGYCVWWMHTENQRRDRLRATGDLPSTTPAYELIEHWLRHPWLTLRARSLAKANPGLGLYDSFTQAREQIRHERRQRAISKVLHRKIRAAVDPLTADIALAVYDLDEVAERLANQADYDTLTALISADLAPARLALPTAEPAKQPDGHTADGAVHVEDETAGEAKAAGEAESAAERDLVEAQTVNVPAGPSPVGPAGARPVPEPRIPPVYEPVSDEDAAMYELWCRGVAAGQEPSGVDLARAAGRANDASGIGRKAARRYRDAHAEARTSAAPFTAAALHNGATAPWHHNGHRSDGAAA
jgi:hypothetical protein